MQSTPESGNHAGYDGTKRCQGSKVYAAVDTLGNLLTLLLSPANKQDRAQVGAPAQAIQAAIGHHVEVVFVDQDYTSDASSSESHRWMSPFCSRPVTTSDTTLRPQGTCSETTNHEGKNMAWNTVIL